MDIILLMIWLSLTGIYEPINKAQIVLKDNQYELHVDDETMQMQVVSNSIGIIVPKDSISGLFLNDQPVIKTTIKGKSEKRLDLIIHTAKDEKAKVEMTFVNGVIQLSVVPENNDSNIVSIRFGGMPVAHGLGDAGGWNESFDLAGSKEKIFKIENDGGRKRWLSTFTIFPNRDFAGVFFDRGKKHVVLSEKTYRLYTEKKGMSTFYFFTGNVKEIYAKFKKTRNELGFKDIQPKSRLFELGWESWDALGWNTNQNSVKEILSKYLSEGYPIRWAVTGSGFWDEGGTTTSFGRYGKKFSDPVALKNWMHQNDIYWMVGMRTNLIPSGGPYFPTTKKRDKNLEVQSFYGNDDSVEAIAKNILLNDSENVPLKFTSTIFPIVACYLIDGNQPGAAKWFQEKYSLWQVDGIKEDTMMDLGGETSIFNKPISEIANKGGLVMARCGEVTSPGTLQRINDTGVREISNRIPINYFQYAASGAPNVYSDVAGVHNMNNIVAVDLNIRHTWLLSLTAGLAVGAFPSKWDRDKQVIFKKAIDFHHALVPYLFSAGMKSYLTGFPYALTPMSLAYSKDNTAVEFDNFQWMVGESILAAPLLKNYKEGEKDIYLPAGVWYDWESNKKHMGPVTLKNYKIPLDKTPCFVGGKGVVIFREAETAILKARIYEVGKKQKADFFTRDFGETYSIDVATLDLKKAVVKNMTTGLEINLKRKQDYLEFTIKEGQNYRVQ